MTVMVIMVVVSLDWGGTAGFIVIILLLLLLFVVSIDAVADL